MKNISTKFPLQIDDRVFFQDINISQVPIYNYYKMLLKDGKYTKASDYLNKSEVSFYGAWCLNLIENRLLAIENYTMGLDDIDITTYTNLEPFTNELTDNYTWLGGNEDNG